MENNILEEVKEILEHYDQNKKEILEMDSKVNDWKSLLDKEQQEFEQEFADDKPNNPAYMERKMQKKQSIDAALKKFSDVNNLLENKKNDMENAFKLNKQSILKKVQDNRELLMKQYELMKNPQKVTEMKQNIEDLNTQKEQILNEIEAIKKEILHKQVTIKYFNSEYLEGQVESLNKKVADIDNKINTQIEANNELNIENLGKINFEEEFNKLDDIEEILKKPYISKYAAKGLQEVYNKYEKNKENEKDAKAEEKIELKDKEDKQNDKTDETVENKNQDYETNYKTEDIIGKNDKQQENKVANPVKTNKNEKEKREDEVHDLKFNNTDYGYYNKPKARIYNIESISIRISENGVPIYTIETKDGKKPEEIYITNIKEYNEILNDIAVKADITKKESKKLDPFLIDIISKNGIDDTTSIQKILNKDINIKYDMENLKKLPFMSRNNFRKIARGAQNNEIEVENFKDVWYRELAKKIKNVPQMLKGKEEPKQLNEAKKDTKDLKNKTALREKAHKLKTKAICGYMIFDNKIGEKFTDLSGKLKNKISKRQDKKNMTKHQQFAQSVHYENPEAQKIVDDWGEQDKQRIAKAVKEIKAKRTLNEMDNFLTIAAAGKDEYFDRHTLGLKPEHSEKFCEMMDKVDIELLDAQSYQKFQDLQTEFNINYMQGTIYDKDGKLSEKLKQIEQDRNKKVKAYIENNKTKGEGR